MRALLFFLLAIAAKASDAPTTTPGIAIQPFGEVRAERIEVVRKGLEKAFGAHVTILKSKALPKEAWYAPRQRYRADAILDHLADKTPESHPIVIGLTAKDISTAKGEHDDWGIFGLGEIDGRACVVSSFRLGARGADEAKLRERLRKIAIHEVGHVMGLYHCEHDRCVMNDAEGSIATVDAETGAFCKDCQSKLTLATGTR